jgi:hypothetical protein
MRPSIIIDRGAFSWTNMYRNEALPLPDTLGFPRLSESRINNYSLKDQLGGSITMNVIAKSAYAADQIANEIFIQISAYREWFKEKGIHKFRDLGVGKENMVKVSSADVELASVSVQASFTREEQLILTERLFNARVYKDGEEIFEGIDFVFLPGGVQVLLKQASPESNFTIDYIDGVTLEEKLNKDLISDSTNNRLYTVSENGSVYGYYNLFETFKASKDSEEWIEESQQA